MDARQSQLSKCKEIAKNLQKTDRATQFLMFVDCVNMKWVRIVLWKIQSGHDYVHRLTDGQADGRKDGQCETSKPHLNFVERAV